jgi:GNAT superfamily N-acetyltransferase
MDSDGTLEISAAWASDLPAILGFTASTLAAHRTALPSVFADNLAANRLAETLKTSFRDSKGRPIQTSRNILVARRDGRLLGYLAFKTPIDAPALRGNTIIDLYVDERFRRQGIATALVKEAQALCTSHNWVNLHAYTWSGNDAATAVFNSGGFDRVVTHWRYGPDSQVAQARVPWHQKLLEPSWVWVFAAFVIGGLVAQLN